MAKELRRDVPVGTSDTVTEENLTSSEGAVVELTSCDGIVNVAARATCCSVEISSVTEPVQIAARDTGGSPATPLVAAESRRLTQSAVARDSL